MVLERETHFKNRIVPRRSDVAESAAELVPIVFLVIVATVALDGLGVGRVAERLGLASSSPQGVLFVGGAPFVVETVQRLEEEGIGCLVVARDYGDLAGARRAGLRTVVANILSDYAVRDLDLSGIGRLIATTPSDEVNATAAREFAQVLGRANVFQLQRSEHAAGHDHSSRRAPAAHLTARTPFRPAVGHDELATRMEQGAKNMVTRLSDEFGMTEFREVHGEDAVVLFVLRDGVLDVATERAGEPGPGDRVVALVSR